MNAPAFASRRTVLFRRRTVLFGAILAAVVVVGAVSSVRVSMRKDTQRVAEPLLGCPAADITVKSSDSDEERYEVEGCGRSGTIYCPAPDHECFLEPP